MTSAITSPPNQYDFGYDFNYAQWTEKSVVTLVNVPWNNDYRDIVKFENKAALNTYIDSLEGAGVGINNLSYAKPNAPVRINLPFNAVYRYNYLRASNPLQPVPGGDIKKDFYYFIIDVRYIAPNNTELVLQLDIWQTFGFDATFGNCYIERGHIGIANANAFANYGRDFLTIPEGIDTGSEYQVVTTENRVVMSEGEGSAGGDVYNILVVSTVDLLANPGTVADPHLSTATGGMFAGMPSGATQYLWRNAASFQAWLTIAQNVPWITQGIVSITVVPPIERYTVIGWAPGNAPTRVPVDAWGPRSYTMKPAWRESTELSNYIPARYHGLDKLKTYPYTVIELTTFSGTPIIVKPESWADPDARVIERINPVPPDQRVAITPFRYNALPNAIGDAEEVGIPSASFPAMGDDKGEYLDFATYIQNFPTLAIVNNAAIAYLAANKNGLAFSASSADWSQQRALASNQVGYDQASSGMNLANELTGISTGANSAQTALANDVAVQRAAVGAVGAIAGGVGGGAAGIAGGVGAAAMGGINAAISINQNTQGTAIQNNASRASTRAGVGNQGFVRDTNKNLADWAARGDYSNTIAGINAKVQDSKLLQPTTSGQVGGDAMNLVNNNVMVSARFKMIDHAAIRVVGEYWLRYGYAVRQFATLPPALQVMSKFTYWKLSETYISSSMMPEGFKQVIRGIFEKGVTVWANPADIGNTDIADNAPLEGISL